MLHLRGVVLPGDETRDVFVTEEGRISFESKDGDARTILDGGFLIPGLADVHAHLPMSSPAGNEASEEDRVRASARAQVEAGVLTVREPGGSRLSAELRVEDGFPRVISAGRWLAGPGRFVPGFATEVSDEELPEAALAELAAGAGWVKIIGNWRAEGEEVGSASFRPETLAAAVAAVHRAGGRMAIHATIREVAQAAIAAGCDSIEHGSRMEQSDLEAMAKDGIALVPTLSAALAPQPPEFAERPEEVRRDVLAEVERAPGRVREAWEAGITILAGTDVAAPHGDIRQEVEHFLAAGLPPEVALGAASWEARTFLGLPLIEEGAPGDIVGFERDPREDPAALADPVLVVLDGRVLREGGGG
jgi:imidazolonepropionase-like amidohydrolase